MGSLRKRIGIFLLAGMAMISVVPTVLAGPQESPGVRMSGADQPSGSFGPQESPGVILNETTDLMTELIVPALLRVIP